MNWRELTCQMFDRSQIGTHQYRYDRILPRLSEAKHHRNKQLSNDRPYHQGLHQKKEYLIKKIKKIIKNINELKWISN